MTDIYGNGSSRIWRAARSIGIVTGMVVVAGLIRMGFDLSSDAKQSNSPRIDATAPRSSGAADSALYDHGSLDSLLTPAQNGAQWSSAQLDSIASAQDLARRGNSGKSGGARDALQAPRAWYGSIEIIPDTQPLYGVRVMDYVRDELYIKSNAQGTPDYATVSRPYLKVTFETPSGPLLLALPEVRGINRQDRYDVEYVQFANPPVAMADFFAAGYPATAGTWSVAKNLSPEYLDPDVAGIVKTLKRVTK